MRRRIALSVLALGISVLIPASVSAHCQIPCGIYDDSARIDMLNEHITTIEKSMKLIVELSAEGEKNFNQIVRWVNNKEDHAQKFMDIVTDYFMAQRIKPAPAGDAAGQEAYLKKLQMLHSMLLSAMKCKQTTDTSNTEGLKKLTADFKEFYFK